MYFSVIKDSRFSFIIKDEFIKFYVFVFILINFEDVRDYMDWEVSGIVLGCINSGYISFV